MTKFYDQMLHNTLAGTGIVMTMSITGMQFFTEILSTSKVVGWLIDPYVPVNKFSVILGQSQRFLCITSAFLGE